jgi:hypothetical protein
MEFKQILIVSLLLVSVIGLTGCTEETGSDEWFTENTTGEYNANETTSLIVESLNGNIDITIGSEDFVKVDVEKRVLKENKDVLENVKVEVIEEISLILVQVTYEIEVRNVSVNLDIVVPDFVWVESIHNKNGNIQVSNTMGNLTISNDNGNVVVTDVDGHVNVYLDNGDITITGSSGLGYVSNKNGQINVQLLDFTDDIEITNSNGEITVNILSSVPADIKMTTQNGVIFIKGLSIDLTVNQDTNKEGTLNGGGNLITIQTGNGNINLNKLE